MAKLTLKGAKKKAWGAFSKFIRQRDPKCVTCGKQNKAHAKYCVECGTALEIFA